MTVNHREGSNAMVRSVSVCIRNILVNFLTQHLHQLGVTQHNWYSKVFDSTSF